MGAVGVGERWKGAGEVGAVGLGEPAYLRRTLCNVATLNTVASTLYIDAKRQALSLSPADK